MPGLSVPGRWPEGFRCAGCGHGAAYRHQARLIDECVACGKQHSLLAGTIFEQTKTGLARWFLAIYLVTSSKGGISAMELQRQMGFGSYQTAWTWLHKIRKAMVGPDREPLAARVEADETWSAAPGPASRAAVRPARPWSPARSRAAAARPAGRRLGRLRLPAVPDASATSLEGFLAANVAKPADRRHRRLVRLCAASPPPATTTSRSTSAAAWGDAALRLPAIHLVFGLAKRWLLGTHHGAVSTKHLPGLSRRVRLPLQPPHRQEHQPPLRPPDRAGRPHPTRPPTAPSSANRRRLTVMES